MRKHYGFLKLRSYDDARYRLVHPQRATRCVRYESARQLADLEDELRQLHEGEDGFWLEEPATCEMPVLYDSTTIYGIFPRLPFIEDPEEMKTLVMVSGTWVDAPREALPKRIHSWGHYLVEKGG